jgi:ABC-type Fe3+/spermidine/putrescine transport system ATPase subunit
LPGGATVDVRRGSLRGGPGRLILRPDRIVIAPAGAADDLPRARMRGTVRQRLYQGSHFEYVVAMDDETTVRVFARAEIAAGTTVLLGIDGQDCVLIGSEAAKQGAGQTCR